MASKRKLYLKALNNPRGLRFSELTSLVEAFGFVLDRQRGSHRIDAREDVRELVNVHELVNVQPRSDGKAKTAQVESFLGLVERLRLRLEEDEG